MHKIAHLQVLFTREFGKGFARQMVVMIAPRITEQKSQSHMDFFVDDTSLEAGCVLVERGWRRGIVSGRDFAWRVRSSGET